MERAKASTPLVILGSSKSDGNTRKAVDLVIAGHPVEVVDLSKLNISYYDYDNANVGDDFIPLAEKMLRHDPLILATPVYWYSMSGIMKTFVDRWTDLITVRKDIGRKLKGKKIFLISTFAGEFPAAFEDPFRLTSGYLDMDYAGCYCRYSGDDESKIKANDPELHAFRKKLGLIP